MTDMEILSQMIKDTALVSLQDEYDKPLVRLGASQASDSSATIRNLPADTMVIKVDTFRSPDDIFKGGIVNANVPITPSSVRKRNLSCISKSNAPRTDGSRSLNN